MTPLENTMVTEALGRRMEQARVGGGVVVWWCGGVVVWWCVGVVVWWCVGLVV